MNMNDVINEYDDINIEKQIEIKLRQEEIAMLTAELLEYQLTFSDLVDSSPSHKDTRNEVLNIAQKENIDNRTAAYINAVGKVAEAMKFRGIWP